MLGVIADDATGGTDIASVLRREGVNVLQTFGVPKGRLPDADAIVISLKSRTAPVADAIRWSLEAADFLISAGAQQLYFKYCSTFDSTDSGNIGAVIQALLEKTGATATIACPAYPKLRRTIYQGYLFVGDQLLSESPMRYHPLTPMTDSNLVRVLTRQGSQRICVIPLETVEAGQEGILTRYSELVRNGCRVAVVDAIFDRHVSEIGSAFVDYPLVTGGAALGGALVKAGRHKFRGAEASPHTQRPGGSVAILSGSCSAATRVQVENAARHIPARALDPIQLGESSAELEAAKEWACNHARHGDLMIFSTSEPSQLKSIQERVGMKDTANLVDCAFASLARTLAESGVRTFVVAGGETSAAVLDGLGITQLSFGDEIDPGVPWTASVEPPGFALALKSGNFGSDDFFLRALETSR